MAAPGPRIGDDWTMALEDKQLAMQVRREIVRRMMDASRISIHVAGGHVEIGGIVRQANRNTPVDLERELEHVRERAIRIPAVRDVTWKYLRFAR